MKIVLQDGMKDCGICCLLSIMKYYGGSVSKEYLRQLTNTTKNGVTAYSLIKAARSLGFTSNALSGDIEQVNLSNLPCIAHVIINKSYQHFIVIYEIDLKKNRIYVMDPAKGKKTLSVAEFKLMSSNTYIFLIPNKKLPILVEKRIVKEIIIKELREDKKSFVFLFILTLSYFCFNIFSAFHFKYLLDFAIKYNVSDNVNLISMFMISIYIIKELSFTLRNILLIKYSETIDYRITTKIYSQLILLPYLYYKNRTTGEILSRIKDLSLIKNYIVKLFTIFSADVFSCFIFIFLLFNINKVLTILSVFIFTILIVLNLLFKGKYNIFLRKYYRKEEKLNSYLIESLSSVDVIKGMHTEKLTIDKLKLKYQNFLESVYNLSLSQEVFSFIIRNINNIFQIIILGLGSYYVIKGKLNLSSLIIYQSILSFLNSSVNNIVDLIHNYSEYKLSKERVEDLFNIEKENFLGSDYYYNLSLNGNIVYTNLNYTYNSKKVLDSINVVIRPKDKIFLCGPSGSGKSTFVKLLMRYLEVSFGNIKINNIDINHYHLDILRNKITYVSQQEFLFTDSLYNNITLGKDYSKEKIDKIIKMTLVNEFIKNDTLAYNQLVEENGFNFSGGERQRIILARSILKDSDIYIFDEALSQIDIEREKKILNNIFKYLKDKIIIVISHRNDNRELFNRVFEIKNGKLNEKKV